MEALVEREWLQAGYPFPIRHQKSCYSSGRSKTQAPTFLLFLDCVGQIHQQFPCSFEFSTSFLIMLFEHSYCSQFGKFLLPHHLFFVILRYCKYHSKQHWIHTYYSKEHAVA
jgi:myotubularin-related protein 9